MSRSKIHAARLPDGAADSNDGNAGGRRCAVRAGQTTDGDAGYPGLPLDHAGKARIYGGSDRQARWRRRSTCRFAEAGGGGDATSDTGGSRRGIRERYPDPAPPPFVLENEKPSAWIPRNCIVRACSRIADAGHQERERAGRNGAAERWKLCRTGTIHRQSAARLPVRSGAVGCGRAGGSVLVLGSHRERHGPVPVSRGAFHCYAPAPAEGRAWNAAWCGGSKARR